MTARHLLLTAVVATASIALPATACASVTWNDGMYVCRPEEAGLRGFHVRFSTNDDDVTTATVVEDDNTPHEVQTLRNDESWEWGTSAPNDVFNKFYVFAGRGEDTTIEIERSTDSQIRRHFHCEQSGE